MAALFRVRLLSDCKGPHPDFNPRQPAGPDNPRECVVPAGTVLEGPEVFVHCLPDANDDIRAEPADEATAQFVADALDRRATILQRLSTKHQQARQKLKQRLAGNENLNPPADESGTSPSVDEESPTAKRTRRKPLADESGTSPSADEESPTAKRTRRKPLAKQ